MTFADESQAAQVVNGVLVSYHEHFVLCVDDNPMTLAALKRTLRDEPYEVLVADTPESALEVLETRPISLLLCDQRMPEMSGLDVVRAARAAAPEMTCLILTGYPESIPLRDTIHCGVRFIIEKPWNDRELRKMIRHLLRERELLNESGPD